MPFDMYGDVILTRDVTERRLRAGDVGTVVERHVVPGVPEEGLPERPWRLARRRQWAPRRKPSKTAYRPQKSYACHAPIITSFFPIRRMCCAR
jgi:hypothetical protein